MGDGTAEGMKKMLLAEAKLVAEIEFLEWTLDNHHRHPKFVALRDDRVTEKSSESVNGSRGTGVMHVSGSLIVKGDWIET